MFLCVRRETRRGATAALKIVQRVSAILKPAIRIHTPLSFWSGALPQPPKGPLRSPFQCAPPAQKSNRNRRRAWPAGSAPPPKCARIGPPVKRFVPPTPKAPPVDLAPERAAPSSSDAPSRTPRSDGPRPTDLVIGPSAAPEFLAIRDRNIARLLRAAASAVDVPRSQVTLTLSPGEGWNPSGARAPRVPPAVM